jgi:hypothetical protein
MITKITHLYHEDPADAGRITGRDLLAILIVVAAAIITYNAPVTGFIWNALVFAGATSIIGHFFD